MIVKHITGLKRSKTPLTGLIIRVVLRRSLFSVHQSGRQPARLHGNTASLYFAFIMSAAT